MAERQWGRIINIASTIGFMPNVNMAAYGATKAAMHNLTVALTRDLGTGGVTVNAISPGLTKSASIEHLLQMMVEAYGWPSEPAQLEQKAVGAWAPNPVGRMGRVEDVANLVAFVASPLADYINGSNLRIDGGLDPTISWERDRNGECVKAGASLQRRVAGFIRLPTSFTKGLLLCPTSSHRFMNAFLTDLLVTPTPTARRWV